MVHELVTDFIQKGNPRPDLALASFGPKRIEGIVPETELPMLRKQVRIILRNSGVIDPTNIRHYIGRNGYSGLAKALSVSPEKVIEEIKKSGLRGRGGAGFSTGIKWELALKSKGDIKYIICNADEGDPGAFMNRSVLESDPHSVLEGMVIGAYAIGSHYGYMYVRAEYPLAITQLKKGIKDMHENGFLGENILGSGFHFDIIIKEGAGAFVCGEETALIASIEGKRGMPRPRPPFPAVSGLFGKPTNINNVETFANTSAIMAMGSAEYAKNGTEKSKGTKTFALAGKIIRTGLIEVPLGISLKEIIFDIGGGIPDGKKLKGVQTGGPSGGCLPASLIDMPVDYENLTQAGTIMGSGGMIVMDEDTCMVDIARYFLEFSKAESCGKCVPCRMGSQHLLNLVKEIIQGKATLEHIKTIETLSSTIKLGSLCGLGQNLPNPVMSTLRYFKDEFENHILRKKCDALVCKALISSPCQYTCPIGQDVPSYLSYIAVGEYEKALEVIRLKNPLPGICGRVCPHECEKKCEAGKYGDPIAIRALKRFAADYELKSGSKPKAPAAFKSQSKVAIIGSGPAGLTAAYFLTLKGVPCTIFEALPLAGGMLAVGIPEFRLPKKILKNEIDFIVKMGVEIKTNYALGKDFSLDDLFKQDYKAVFIAIGAHKSMELKIPGSENSAVISGVAFLRDLNLGHPAKLGKKIAVMGGGNVAVDSARSALRLGCKEVFIVYRRSREEMPALHEELIQLEEEGVQVKFLTNPVKAVIENGVFKGIECVRMELGEPDKSGRRKPVPVEGSNFFLECDNLISAIGQTSDLEGVQKSGVSTTPGGTISVDLDVLATNRNAVFAGGDVVSGPANVVTAMSHGQRAAESIAQYLEGKPVVRIFSPIKPAVAATPVPLTDEEMESLERPELPCMKAGDRTGNFAEVENVLEEKLAVREAKRCLRCDLQR
jgi:NADH-quinone oxidoreductase subunit F